MVNMHKKFELNRTKIKGAISCLNKKWSGILALFTFSLKTVSYKISCVLPVVSRLTFCLSDKTENKLEAKRQKQCERY